MNRNTRFLVVGLGLIGGAYARRLTAMGYAVDALDINPDSIEYALQEGIIQNGAAYSDELVGRADFIVFGLYPTAMVDWLRALIAGGVDPSRLEKEIPFAGVLLKKDKDLRTLQRARR